jgi:hypothetical protein
MKFYGLQSYYRHGDLKNYHTANRIPTVRIVGRHAKNWTIADNVNSLHLWELWTNSEESGLYNCVLKRNSEVSTPNILTRKSEEGPLPYCRTGVESEGNNRPGPLLVTPSKDHILPFLQSFLWRPPYTKLHSMTVYYHTSDVCQNITVENSASVNMWILRRWNFSLVWKSV